MDGSDAMSEASVAVIHSDLDKQQTGPSGAPATNGTGGGAQMAPAPLTANQKVPQQSSATTTNPEMIASDGQNRAVSCVADTSTQKEVVVECFAPYDDHRYGAHET